MKIRSTVTISSAAAILGSVYLPLACRAWITTPSSRTIGSSAPPRRFSTTTATTTFLQSTIAPDEESTAASTISSSSTPSSPPPPSIPATPASSTSTSPPKIIAEGTVVSQFQGGLIAIRLSDDDGNDAGVLGADSDSPTFSLASSTIGGDVQGKEVVFPNGAVGVVVAHRPPVAFVYTNSIESDGVTSGGKVKLLDRMATISIRTDENVVDWSAFCGGDDTKGDTSTTMKRAIFAQIPKVSDIALINNPMLTGITMFDTLSPIGQGQNMLFVSHDEDDMRRYAMDFIRTQLRDDSNKKQTKCIYASTKQTVQDVERQLRQNDIDPKDVHILGTSPPSNDMHDASKAAEAVAIAGAACAAGEAYAIQRGMNALVVVDTIDFHKQLWDMTTRVLVDVYGVDAVVKVDREGGASSEMRGFYSSLIQRSGQYKPSKGGGSVTLLLLTTVPRGDADESTVFTLSDFDQCADRVKERIKLLVDRNIPLTAATLRKIDFPIPTEGHRRMVLQHVDDLISMSDGQIWLDERLEAKGQQPPFDPQRSVTRIGIGADTNSRADAPALRRVAERLRLDLSQALSMDGAEDTAASKKQVQRKDALLLAMHQKSGSGGRRLSESCVALLAASEGYLDKAVGDGIVAGTEAGEKLVQSLMDHVFQVAASTMTEIDTTLDLTSEARTQLSSAIASFFTN